MSELSLVATVSVQVKLDFLNTTENIMHYFHPFCIGHTNKLQVHFVSVCHINTCKLLNDMHFYVACKTFVEKDNMR